MTINDTTQQTDTHTNSPPAASPTTQILLSLHRL